MNRSKRSKNSLREVQRFRGSGAVRVGENAPGCMAHVGIHSGLAWPVPSQLPQGRTEVRSVRKDAINGPLPGHVFLVQMVQVGGGGSSVLVSQHPLMQQSHCHTWFLLAGGGGGLIDCALATLFIRGPFCDMGTGTGRPHCPVPMAPRSHLQGASDARKSPRNELVLKWVWVKI